ncbi:MAG: glycosyltransferase family 4 protein [Deltaproteobacteria bacterium]|jgi:glycosyltransferase involved in cell wall biosynthesis|nr:glycosyltransferase family 4 protein [Deltaproteobacteria bacterium]
MHIGLIIYGRLDNLTGGWLYDRLLVEDLRRRGHTVAVIALKQQRYVYNLADNFSGRLFRRLVDHGCSLLLQDGLVHPSLAYLNRRIKRRQTSPLITIVHQVLSRQPLKRLQRLFYQAVERRYLSSVDGFIFNSETTRAGVESLVSRPRPYVVASPGGDRLGCLPSTTLIDTRSRRRGPLQLVCVSNLTPNKGILPLIAGLARLPPATWRLNLIGSLTMDRAYVNRVKALIARHGLQDRIDMPGPLDGEALAAQLESSHVFVLPFSYEGFGIACLEAMAWGLPVVGSGRGALKEFVRDGINGVLIPPGSLDAFARQIAQLNEDREQLAGYGREALKTYHGRPLWRDSLQKIHAFLLSMIK